MSMIEEYRIGALKAARQEIDRLREENARLQARIEEIQKLYASSAHRRATYHTMLCQIGRMIQEME